MIRGNRYVRAVKVEKTDKPPFYIITANDCGENLGLLTWSVKNCEFVFEPQQYVIFAEHILAAISRIQKAINKTEQEDQEYDEDSTILECKEELAPGEKNRLQQFLEGSTASFHKEKMGAKLDDGSEA